MSIHSNDSRSAPWVAAVAAAATLALSAIDVHAQQRAPAKDLSSEFSFAIPAQPLASALKQFGDITGFQLVYEASLATGKQSTSISGSLNGNDALARLLSGTGLGFRFTDARTVIIHPAARSSDTSRVLGPVRVEGAETRSAVNGVNGSRDVTATEGTGSFTTGAMTIGSKSPRSIKDTPQSVSVITNEQLEQQNISDFTQALQQAPGISFAQGGTSLLTTFYSRGFEVTSIQIDGGAPLTTSFAGSTGNAYFPQIDLSQYDHVEVLRGAAGLFNGYGDPSGTINLVRKKPLDHGQFTVDAEWGSWSHYRGVLDASAPLAFDGELRGRVVASWQSNKYFYETAEDQKTLIYGVVDYDLTPTTLVTAGISQSSQDSTPWHGGLPRYQTGEDLRLPRETGLLFPWNRRSSDTTEVFGSVAQHIGEDWTAKLNITQNKQATTQKAGFNVTSGAVNPIDNRGPRLAGIYGDFASDQLSAEATLSGSFTLLGQKQEITLGTNHSNQDGGGLTTYSALITSSAAQPYQPYPSGPRYCFTTSRTNPCPAGTIAPQTPPIDVFGFDPFDPIYTEPANPLRTNRYSEQGQEQSLAYVNLRLTAFDRLHLETGLRWSRYERKVAYEQFCTPTGGTPCIGRQIGDVYNSDGDFYSGEEFSWPPSVALSYDVTHDLTAYLGYTDIYQDQSNFLDGDLAPLDPVNGENVELGLKWSPRDGRVNIALSAYRIEKQGFSQRDTNVPAFQPDPYHSCCYFQREDQTQSSEGIDAELTGEVLPGWQVSASYTFSQNKFEGSGYSSSQQGRPFLTIQPEHLYKLWTSYDFRAAGATGWFSNLTLSAGVNGQSEGYRTGSVCVNFKDPPPPTGNTSTCVSTRSPDTITYEFTVEPYIVVSGRIDYRLSGNWSAALNLENVFDRTYYQSVGDVSGGNWYGAPRSYTLTLRAKW